MARYPDPLIALIELFRKLPGVGWKTAERYAFQLIDWNQETTDQFASLLQDLKKKIAFCSKCGCMLTKEVCSFCETNQRDENLLCIVPHARDVFAIEDTGQYKGLYHVMGGLLSPINNYDESHLRLGSLGDVLSEKPIKEIIVAFDATLEGDATAFFLKEKLEKEDLKISRLAFGLPMGSALEYIDGGTLSKAFSGRHLF